LKKVVLTFVIVLLSTPITAYCSSLTTDQIHQIAKEAYIYGLPLVMNYKTMYLYSILTSSPEYKAPFNQIYNVARLYTPQDRAFVTPNTDTPYSFLWLDLRAEPMVLGVPAVENDRYYVIQLVDLYTFNFDYIGTRTTGNDAGFYLVAGPGWKGEIPAGINKVSHCETNFALAMYRTQLFNAGDLDNVKRIQAGYTAQPLSAFLDKPAPKSAPAINFPDYDDSKAQDMGLFYYLNFILQFCPVHPSEKDLRARFAQIGIIPGKPFDTTSLSPDQLQAIQEGITDAKTEIDKVWEEITTSTDLYGTRDELKNNYMNRLQGAISGIYGNSKEEAYYIAWDLDADSHAIDTGKNNYVLTFPAHQLPPVRAFWSLTMYDDENKQLVTNPINRYVINSSMLSSLKYNLDGSITIYMHRANPGDDKESNWLPAPDGKAYITLRMYWPQEEVFNGSWMQPEIVLQR
jgi:hypothetical protein